MNPLMSNTQMIQRFQQAKQLMQGIQNPQSLIANNPGMKQVNELIQKYGSPEQAFKETATSMGLNPDDLLGVLR